MFDIKITGATILDGSGSPAYSSDIGICGDTIDAVGDLSAADARQTIDLRDGSATAPIVCPGFIDGHSHSDAYLLLEPSAPSKLSQGVTTEVVGNCGASAAPLFGQYRMPSDWADKKFPGSWQTVAEYRALLEEIGPGPNVVLLVGHSTLRAGAMGYDNRSATDDELATMQARLAQAMAEGARGFSTGLVYPPGMFAPREELVTLAATAAEHSGLYSSHMRNEGDRVIEAIEEALDIGRSSGARVQISHLKARGRTAWPLAEKALDLIQTARDQGLAVAADRYPYTSSWTSLDIMLPKWAQEGGNPAILERVRDAQTCVRIRADLLVENDEDDWQAVILGSTHHPATGAMHGLRLCAVADEWKMAPVDAFLRILDLDELRTGAFFDAMNEANMFRILAAPFVMLGSDASIRTLDGPLSHDYPHPRAFGTFPRFLRMALDGRTVELPEAIRKMTSLPAEHFGLTDRGTIAPGKKADLVIVDSCSVRDTSTHQTPHRLADGIELVMVNGVITWVDGKPSGSRGGRFL